MRITETVLLFSFHSYKITTHAPQTAGARQLVIVWGWYVYDLTGGLTSRGRMRSRDSGLNQRWWEAEHTWAMSSPTFFLFFCICMCENRGGFQWEMNISVGRENNVLKLNSSCNYYEAIIKEYILELRSIFYIINKAYLKSKFCVNR